MKNLDQLPSSTNVEIAKPTFAGLMADEEPSKNVIDGTKPGIRVKVTKLTRAVKTPTATDIQDAYRKPKR